MAQHYPICYLQLHQIGSRAVGHPAQSQLLAVVSESEPSPLSRFITVRQRSASCHPPGLSIVFHLTALIEEAPPARLLVFGRIDALEKHGCYWLLKYHRAVDTSARSVKLPVFNLPCFAVQHQQSGRISLGPKDVEQSALLVIDNQILLFSCLLCSNKEANCLSWVYFITWKKIWIPRM